MKDNGVCLDQYTSKLKVLEIYWDKINNNTLNNDQINMMIKFMNLKISMIIESY